MAAVQRKPGEVPQISRRSQIRMSGDSGEAALLCDSPQRSHRSHNLSWCRGFGMLDGSVGAEGAHASPPSPCAPPLRARKRDAFAESPLVLLIFWGVRNRIKAFCRNKSDLSQRRSGGSAHVPADVHSVAAGGARRAAGLAWERGLHSKNYLGGPSVISC